MKVCPNCHTHLNRGGLYEEVRNNVVTLRRLNVCPECGEWISKGVPIQCPHCDTFFQNAGKDVYVPTVNIITGEPYNLKVKQCPWHACEKLFFIRKERDLKVAVPVESRITVDHLIQIFNAHLRDNHGSKQAELFEMTGKERAIAYKLVAWAEDFLEDNARDVGQTTGEFLEDMLRYVLQLSWWKLNMKSITYLWNYKARLSEDFYEYQASRRDVDSPFRDLRHQALAEGFSESPRH